MVKRRNSIVKIDQILSGGRRRLRTRPEKILMDADGTRLWADYMDVAPGFCDDSIYP